MKSTYITNEQKVTYFFFEQLSKDTVHILSVDETLLQFHNIVAV